MSFLTWKNDKNRPPQLNEFVIYYDAEYLKAKKLHPLFDDKDYLTFIREHNKPLVSLSYEKDKSRYPYVVSLDLLEGFGHQCGELTEVEALRLSCLAQSLLCTK